MNSNADRSQPPPAWRIDIFTQLLAAFLAVALLPLAGYWLLERDRTLASGQRSAEDRLRQFSEGIAHDVDDWTRLNLSVLQSAAEVSAMRTLKQTPQRQVMDAILPQLPWAYLLHTTGLDGRNIARSDDGPPSDYTDRGYYRDILAGQPFSAEVQIGRTSKRPAFLVGVPIRAESGALGGLLIEAATLDEVSKSVAASRLGHSGYAFLMTAEGRLIANSHEPNLAELKDYRQHPAFIAAQSGGEGLHRYRLNGRERLADIRRTRFNWIAVAQQDADEAFADVAAARRHALLLFAITTALVTILSLLVARNFAKPIETLTGVARRLGAGDLDVDITTTRRDQIGDLLRAMQDVQTTLRRFVAGQRALARAHRDGALGYRLDAEPFSGVYREMAEGVNALFAEQIALMLQLLEVIDRYAVGDFTPQLPPQPGDKKLLNETTDKARDNLIAMQRQIVTLVEAAARGDFSVRGDEAAFQNAYRDMVRHLNHLMQTADAGLSELARVQAAVAQGDLSVAMRGEYLGTFANLQRDTNTTIRALAALIDEIERSRALLRATLEHLPEGVSVVDTELTLIAWNRRYAEIFDYPETLLRVGQTVETLLRHNAERGLLGLGDPETQIQGRLAHLRSASLHAHERQMPDGTVLETRGRPIPGIGYVTSYSDISEHKRIEAELRALTETLERRIAERTQDLEHAKAEAERANRYKTRFVSAAVHDLLQPLNAARMFVTSLHEQPGADESRTLTAHADRALAAQEAILTSLLDIARLESGAIDVRVRDFAIAPLLATLGAEFSVLAQARGLRLHWRSSRALVRSDEALLRRVLQNFLSNAVRHSTRGRLLLGCRRTPGGLRIEVWDTGPGIPEAQFGVIYEEFRRLDNGPAVDAQGAGLGLAIVDRIARRLGHKLGLRSWPGRGSVFSITLPFGTAEAPPETPQPAPTTDDTTFAGRRVWYVDDDALCRAAMATLLQRWGCDFELLADAAAAETLAAQTAAPDLLLLDYRLGADTGPALQSRLQMQWKTPVPVILVTAEHTPELRETARAAGWGFLTKPLRPAALRAAMARWLGQPR